MRTTAKKLTDKTEEIKKDVINFINENNKVTDIVYDETAAISFKLIQDSMELIDLYCLYVKELSDTLDVINSRLQTICERRNIVLDKIEES